MDNPQATLGLMLKKLKLSTMAQQHEQLYERALEDEWSMQRYLSELCHIELLGREDKRMRRLLNEAKLPIGKHLASFEFESIEGATSEGVTRITNDVGWMHRGANILFFGASGLGKTHLASAIGYSLVEQGHRVKFVAATALVQQLQQAKQQLRLQDELNKLDKYRVLIVDDVGYVKKTDTETSVLFELIAHRYERHSLILTSNKSFEDWDELFDDSTMTIAAVDRLVHHATIIHCQGESYRRKAALKSAV